MLWVRLEGPWDAGSPVPLTTPPDLEDTERINAPTMGNDLLPFP